MIKVDATILVDPEAVQDAMDDLEAAIAAANEEHGEEETALALAIITGVASVELMH